MKRCKLSLAISLLTLGLAIQGVSYAEPLSKNQDTVSRPGVVERQIQDTLPGWKKLDYFVSQSDIAFRGVVSDIQYRLSDPTEPGQSPIPFTFVTYDILEMIHGDTKIKQVVLRFIGGLDENTMRVMEASNVPNFDLGDEDILFVRDNTRSQSPLVMNDRGRFRVVDGQVYSNSGREVTLDDKDQIQYGTRHALPEILTTTVTGSQGSMVMNHRISAAPVKQISRAIPAEKLIDRIYRLDIPIRDSSQFVNANIYAKLAGPSMKPATAPKELILQQDQPENIYEDLTTEFGEMTQQRRPRIK